MPKTDNALAAVLTVMLFILIACSPAIIYATYASLW